ncbi:MAG: glycosyltransferase [Candidatus Omnitrophota bacterium]
MKVIVVYASSGAGHQKAAEAISKTLQERPGLQVQLIDSLDYTAPFFRYSYPRVYLFLVRYLPSVWGFFYDGLNVALIGPPLRALRRLLNAVNGRGLEKFFLSEKPDIIVSTHFFASEVASAMKRSGKLQSCLVTIVTDFVVHSVWITSETDGYTVASRDTRDSLMRRRVPEEKIAMTGIPVNPVFEKEENRLLLAEKLGIAPDKFTVLIASGGFGVGPIEQLVNHLSQNERLQLLVVCGHNRSLYERLQAETASLRERVILYEFVNNIHELMSVSDCMVSKSGGLTMSEALAKQLPAFILYPIPGQEMGNRDILVRHQAALAVRNIRDLEGYFQDLGKLQEMLAKVRREIQQFREQHSAHRIADYVLSKGQKK